MESGATPVQPDVILVSRERSEIIGKQNICGVPDLLVEVLSPGSADHDQVAKFQLDERCGVPEYWIADPDQRHIDIYTLSQGRYSLRGRFAPGMRADSRVLRGLEVDVEEAIPPESTSRGGA
ncbi:MAG: Uma2 family endonuclease [Planctomycetota bacterium]